MMSKKTGYNSECALQSFKEEVLYGRKNSSFGVRQTLFDSTFCDVGKFFSLGLSFVI